MRQRHPDLAGLDNRERKTLWQRKKRGGTSWAEYVSKVHAEALERARNPIPCAVEGCGLPQKSKGYCQCHYARWKRHGDPLHGRVMNSGNPSGKNVKEQFSDMPKTKIIISREILKSLGR